MRVGPYRFFFYSNEGEEPPHIHVKAGGEEAKFWLDPMTLATNHGFNGRALNEIQRLVEQHRAGFLEAWDEHLGEDQSQISARLCPVHRIGQVG